MHLMEGADRVASYQIDLGAAQGGIFAEQQQPGGGGGRGRGGEGNVHESDPKPKLKVLFHVDDAGVPSVQSARSVYTYFVG